MMRGAARDAIHKRLPSANRVPRLVHGPDRRHGTLCPTASPIRQPFAVGSAILAEKLGESLVTQIIQ